MKRTIKRYIVADKNNNLYWSKDYGFVNSVNNATVMSQPEAEQIINKFHIPPSSDTCGLSSPKLTDAQSKKAQEAWKMFQSTARLSHGQSMFKIDTRTLTVEPIDLTFELSKNEKNS